MTMTQFDWKQVPSLDSGFVDYCRIPSMKVRLIIAQAEMKKLQEELRARKQWTMTDANQRKIAAIETHLKFIERDYAVNEPA
ncbi:hypothetical protein [uncultured Endozoicomonas sp.]|uniref:hypothetical protein n=1 Tax=uncultured Endozoicomonas sp. TaxID=432652 RepID=UPI00262B79BE|nr:hypothetical protein [uncultured Endozoicomonas sp.]